MKKKKKVEPVKEESTAMSLFIIFLLLLTICSHAFSFLMLLYYIATGNGSLISCILVFVSARVMIKALESFNLLEIEPSNNL